MSMPMHHRSIADNENNNDYIQLRSLELQHESNITKDLKKDILVFLKKT